jgi:hypothetical protein
MLDRERLEQLTTTAAFGKSSPMVDGVDVVYGTYAYPSPPPIAPTAANPRKTQRFLAVLGTAALLYISVATHVSFTGTTTYVPRSVERVSAPHAYNPQSRTSHKEFVSLLVRMTKEVDDAKEQMKGEAHSPAPPLHAGGF